MGEREGIFFRICFCIGFICRQLDTSESLLWATNAPLNGRIGWPILATRDINFALAEFSLASFFWMEDSGSISVTFSLTGFSASFTLASLILTSSICQKALPVCCMRCTGVSKLCVYLVCELFGHLLRIEKDRPILPLIIVKGTEVIRLTLEER